MSNDLVGVSLNGASHFHGNKAPSDDLEKIKQIRIFHRGIVIDTMCDPSLHNEVPKTLSESQIEIFKIAPRNSIICRLLTDGNSLSEKSDIVCYPFFQSHFSMPINPGEQVWVYRENFFEQSFSERAYWISRVSDCLVLEDVNYTPFSREVTLASTGSNKTGETLTYPNSSTGVNTKKIIEGDDFAIEKLITNSKESNRIKINPVPRYTKRPGEHVLQGSSNSLISLGNIRYYNSKKRPEDKQQLTENIEEKSATIDIVVGRGMYFDSNESLTNQQRKKKILTTKPFISKNRLGFETDKNPEFSQDKIDGNSNPGNKLTNPCEGDPDYLLDASRIILSESSNVSVDDLFDIEKYALKNFEKNIDSKIGPFFAIKSNHLRLISRNRKSKIYNSDVNDDGSILILNENDDDSLSFFAFEPDGSTTIKSKKIFMGSMNSSGGPGPGGSQPYVKYQQLENLWFKTVDTIDLFCDTLLKHVTPGYGNPSPQINKAAADLKSELVSLRKEIESVKSETIFGE